MRVVSGNRTVSGDAFMTGKAHAAIGCLMLDDEQHCVMRGNEDGLCARDRLMRRSSPLDMRRSKTISVPSSARLKGEVDMRLFIRMI